MIEPAQLLPNSSAMDLLLIAACVCFVAGLLLPAYRSHGFFSFGGPGWKVFGLSLVMMAAGVVALAKDSGDKVLLFFLPGLLNLAAVALLLVGLGSIQGTAVQLLGWVTLLGWCAVVLLMFAKSRDDLQVGSYFWFAACVLLSLHAIQA